MCDGFSIIWFVWWAMLYAMIVWPEPKECYQSQEHQQVIDKLEGIERACTDIGMHLQE